MFYLDFDHIFACLMPVSTCFAPMFVRWAHFDAGDCRVFSLNLMQSNAQAVQRTGMDSIVWRIHQKLVVPLETFQ